MKNIFVLGLCFTIVAGPSVFAELTKVKELEKRVEALTINKSKAISDLQVLTDEFRKNTSKIAKVKGDARAGRDISNIYDKTDVDDETADLIDRCKAARDEYAKLEKELKDNFAKSEAGIAQAKRYDEAIKSIDVVKGEQSEVIKKRAIAAQDVRVVVKELKAAMQELKTAKEAEKKLSK